MASPLNGNGGAVTKGWVLMLLLPVMLGLLVWVAKGLASDLQAESDINVTQQREIDRLKLLGEVTDERFKVINRKLDLLLEEVPRR